MRIETGRPVIAEARIRPLRPSDFTPVIAVIDEWWGGRPMARMLPRLFFDHFTDTSFAADRDGALAGFLVGFVSPSQPGDAYIHFVGVHPGERGHGLGRRLYGTFFDAVRAPGLQARAGGNLAGEHRLGRLPSPDGVPARAGRRPGGRRPGSHRVRRPRAGPCALRQGPAVLTGRAGWISGLAS